MTYSPYKEETAMVQNTRKKRRRCSECKHLIEQKKNIRKEPIKAKFKAVVNTVRGLLASRRVFSWLPLVFFCSYSSDSD